MHPNTPANFILINLNLLSLSIRAPSTKFGAIWLNRLAAEDYNFEANGRQTRDAKCRLKLNWPLAS